THDSFGGPSSSADPHSPEVRRARNRAFGGKHLPGTVGEDADQMNASILAGLVWESEMHPTKGDGVDFGSVSTSGKLGDAGEDMTSGCPVAHRDRDVHHAVAYGVKGRGRSYWVLRQHVELEPPAARLLNLVRKSLEHDSRQGVRPRRP